MQSLTFTVPSPDDAHILHGHIWTPNTPRAVLALVHGLGEHSGRYAHMAKHLANHGIATAAIDLRGHGKTRGKRGLAKDVDALLANIEALLYKTRQRFDGLPVILMGHSMGGGLALKYALDHPGLDIKAVIAQAPLIKPAKPVPSILQGILKRIHRVAPDFRLKSRFKGSDISTLPREAKLYQSDPLNHGYLGAGLGISLFASGEDIARRAAQFSYPVLLSHGTDDVLTSFKATQDFSHSAPNAKFIAYENSAHEVHNDLHRAQVYADIIDWINVHI